MAFYHDRAKDIIALHEQVNSSIDVLDSLEGFLSNFQRELTTVSGQISDLQDRSKNMETKLRSRRRIEQPLSSLLLDLTLSPQLVALILDSDVSETWLTAMPNFERHLDALKIRTRVKAARDLSEVAEGLRIIASTKLRLFFLSLMHPIKTSMSANMQVIQTSLLLKFKPLYLFLQRHAPPVAKEVQSQYVSVARVYYETGFRRYTRSLGWIKARTVEKFEPMANSESRPQATVDEARLAFSKIDGPSVTLGFMADNKSHREPLEGLFRSLLLVLMDNATAEWTFITTFFEESQDDRPTIDRPDFQPIPSPTVTSFDRDGDQHRSSTSELVETDHGHTSPRHVENEITKEQQHRFVALWKSILDPTISHCQTFCNSVLEPIPPVVPLLTMIRLVEGVITEVKNRGCFPLETFIFGLQIKFWPVFQKSMSDHIASIKNMNEMSSGSYFKKRAPLGEAAIAQVAERYFVMFASFIVLTSQEDETMIFSNLHRLRQDVTQLIVNQSKLITDPMKGAQYQTTMFECVQKVMNNNQFPLTHPNAQSERAYWREREDEVRRRVTSMQTQVGRG